MLKFSELAAKLEQRGKDYMQQERNRQRTAYMQSKIAAKMPDWRPIDDNAFDAIDMMVTALAMEAGFSMQPPQQPAIPQQPMPKAAPAITADDERKLADATAGEPRLPLRPRGFA